MIRISTLLTVAVLTAAQLFAQGKLRDPDPLGKPYYPTYGTSLPIIHPSVPPEIGEAVAKRFYDCLSENVQTHQRPYDILDKSAIETGGNRNLDGMTSTELRKNFGVARAGCQALIRVEINSYKQYTIEDSIFNKDTKAFSHIDPHFVVEMNISARFTDVATSKILKYDNFYLNANTKDYSPLTKLKEEEYLKRQLIEAICDKARQIFNGMLAAAPIVEKIFEQDGDKAKVVLLNDAPLAAFCKKRASLNVYGIEKIYKVDDQLFPHVINVGRLEKADDWNYLVSKFNVENGKKDIVEMFGKKDAILICATSKFPSLTYLPSTARTSLVMDNFKIASSVSLSLGKAKMFRDACLDAVASRPLLIDALDREIYDLIEKEKRMQLRMKSNATQGGIAIGSEFLLTGDIIAYRDDEKINYYTAEELAEKANAGKGKDKPKEEQKSTKPQLKSITPTNVPKSVGYEIVMSLDFKMTNVGTGEVVFQKIYKVGGATEVPFVKAKEAFFNKDKADAVAFKQASDQLVNGIWSDIFYYATPKINLLDIIEVSKEEADRVLIGGGGLSGFMAGTPLDVVEVTTETVQGKDLERETVIARLRIKDVFEATSICKVRDGGKELLQKRNNGAKLFVRLGYEK